MKAIITDGIRKRGIFDSTKLVNPWDPDDSPEAWVIGGQSAVNATQLVPAVYAAWQARCKAMADLPFCLYGKGDNIVDSSDDYKNVTGLLENPRMFFWLAEAALVGYGRAYWLKQNNKYNITRGLQYFRPDSVTPVLDKTGLQAFKRTNGVSTQTFTPEEILYMWLPDPSVEIGPPNIYPLASALLCAGALDKINLFVNDFMARGMIKAMVLSAKNMPSKEEAERVETWFNKFMRGVRTSWKVINAEELTPTVIGEGLEAFKGVKITDQLTRQINTAFGTRQLLEDENYATAQVRQREFYVNTIMPDARLIADGLNTQVLNKSGYRLEFNPEQLEAFQQDEAANASALGTLTSALTNSSPDIIELSMSILGFELSDEQLAMLEAIKSQKEQNKIQMAEQMKPKEEPAPEPDDELEDTAIEEDMSKWMRKACKHVGRDVSFVSDVIPSDIQAAIHAGLTSCRTADDVHILFDGTVSSTPVKVQDYAPLLEAMRLEVEAIKSRPQPVPPQPINVNVTNMPPTAPVVNITQEAQERPNVDVKVDVNPTPVHVDAPQVTVTNEI
jgi:phage portal protein BeeE